MKPMLSRGKDNSAVKVFSIFFCIMFFIAGVWSVYEGIKNYKEQLIQQDWPEAEAFVTQVRSRKESSGIRKNRSKTVYDVEYIFDVPPMETYYGNIKGTAVYYDTGDVLTIKYDPDDPNKSTTALAPDVVALVTNTVLSGIFASVGIFVAIVIPNMRMKAKEKKSSLKPRKPYSRNDASLRGYPVKLVFMALWANVSFSGAGVCAIVAVVFILMAFLAK